MFLKVVKLAPGVAAVYWCRGRALEAKGDIPGAIADLEHFLELAPDDGVAPQQVRRWLAEKKAKR